MQAVSLSDVLILLVWTAHGAIRCEIARLRVYALWKGAMGRAGGRGKLGSRIGCSRHCYLSSASKHCSKTAG